MNTEPDLAPPQTARHPVPARRETADPPADPLAKIMITPRAFFAVLAVAALLLGLLLALLPVRVANADQANPGHVTCGNTIGGVETGPLAGQLGEPDDEVLATYVNTCESAVAVRLAYSWPLFFSGALAIVWSGVVRRPTAAASPG